MDEVCARRALQRVAYAEDWLGRLKDDLAAGHSRTAMTHLITAQAELKLLAEQLGPELGWVEAADPVAAPVAPLVSGVPHRTPLAWAAIGVTALALTLFSGRLIPAEVPSARPGILPTATTPAQEPTESRATLAQLPPLTPPVVSPGVAAEPEVLPESQAEPVIAPVAQPAAQARPPLRRPIVLPSATELPASREPASVGTPSEGPVTEPPVATPIPAPSLDLVALAAMLAFQRAEGR